MAVQQASVFRRTMEVQDSHVHIMFCEDVTLGLQGLRAHVEQNHSYACVQDSRHVIEETNIAGVGESREGHIIAISIFRVRVLVYTCTNLSETVSR